MVKGTGTRRTVRAYRDEMRAFAKGQNPDPEDGDLDELIARSLQGRTSEAEEESLRRWRREGVQHEQRYQRVAAVWRATATYEPRARPMALHRGR
jgi:ferric-dicitrate binding protein FerR (iron transport regulator)